MSARNHVAQFSKSQSPAATCSYSDETGPRIRAYLSSMVPLDDEASVYWDGRAIIERIADSAVGTESPRLRLSATDIADVLGFMAMAEPPRHRREGWYVDPKCAPSHIVGFIAVIGCLEENMRRLASERRGTRRARP